MRRPNRRRFSGRRAGSRSGSNLARSPAQGMSRRRFLGTAAAGLAGAATMGMSGVARAAGTPEHAEGSLVMVNSPVYPHPLFISSHDPNTGLIAAPIGMDSERLRYWMRNWATELPDYRTLNEGVSIELKHEWLGLDLHPDAVDIDCLQNKNCRAIVWKDIPTNVPNPEYDPDHPVCNEHPDHPVCLEYLLPKYIVAWAFGTSAEYYAYNPPEAEAPPLPPPPGVPPEEWYALWGVSWALDDLKEGSLNALDAGGNIIFPLASFLEARGDVFVLIVAPVVGHGVAASTSNGTVDKVCYEQGVVVDTGEDAFFQLAYTGGLDVNPAGLPDIMYVKHVHVRLRDL